MVSWLMHMISTPLLTSLQYSATCRSNSQKDGYCKASPPRMGCSIMNETIHEDHASVFQDKRYELNRRTSIFEVRYLCRPKSPLHELPLNAFGPSRARTRKTSMP